MNDPPKLGISERPRPAPTEILSPDGGQCKKIWLAKF